jgi:hypothetical protein
LGLLALVGKSRTSAFKGIKERVWKRIQDWKFKFLSQAGKEILLKAVIQAIPTYCMSVFKIPKALCSEINSMMEKFYWGHKEKDKRIHWRSWNKLCFSKSQGGMGFRDLSAFNIALLTKQIWRLWKFSDSLVAKIMKAKYFPDCSILEASDPLGKNHPSHGGVSKALVTLYVRVWCGELVMGKPFEFGKIDGLISRLLFECNRSQESSWIMLRSVNLLMIILNGGIRHFWNSCSIRRR